MAAELLPVSEMTENVSRLNWDVKLYYTIPYQLLRGNSAGLRYTAFKIIIQYTDSVHLTAPLVRWCVYLLCLW